MELKAIQLEGILETELVGKDVGYSHWNFSGVVLRLIRLLAKEAGLNQDDFSYKESTTNSIYLTYKGVSFGDASFQKQKGRYYRGSYEWTFKRCFVNFWNELRDSYYHDLTFQQMLNKIDEDKNIAADKEAKKLQQAKEIFNMIKEKLGTDDCGARQFIDYLNSHRYSISN